MSASLAIRLVVTVVLLSPIEVLAGGTLDQWSTHVGGDINWFTILPPGNIIVATDEVLQSLDPGTGEIVWKITDLHKIKEEALTAIPGSPYATLALDGSNHRQGAPYTALLDLYTGEEVWNTQALGMGKCFGHYYVPHSSRLFLYGQKSGGSEGRFACLVNIHTGKEYWRVDGIFKDWKPHMRQIGGKKTMNFGQPPLYDTDTTMILYLNRKALRKYNLRDGSRLWESKELKPRRSNFLDRVYVYTSNSPAEGFAEMFLSEDKQTIYAPYQNTVGAFRASDGKALWRKTERLEGYATDMFLTDYGLAVLTRDTAYYNLYMLNPENGKKRWRIPKGLFRDYWEDCLLLPVTGSNAFVFTGNELVRVDWSNGDTKSLGHFHFRWDDQVYSVEKRGDRILINGLQQGVWVDTNGVKLGSFEFEPGHENRTDLFVNYLFAAVLDIVLDVTDEFFDALKRRMSDKSFAMADANNYLVIMSNPSSDTLYEGNGLLRVSKDDGSIDAWIPIDTPEPVFLVNWYHNSLVIQTGHKELTGYVFSTIDR